MELDMDADFPEDDKPWRLPGTDLSDYFNYGFDEFTWASYCLKQQNLRNEAKEQKKVIEDMQNFMGMGGPPAVPVNAMPGMPADMPLEMQQMMQQMMATGVDPSQMDFNGFMQMMGPQAGMGGPGPAQQQGPPMQQQHQQQGGFGFGGGGGGGGYGQQGGRGRGQGRRNY
jgi:pre-mRNA 3'-end-processing factor FIP1